MISDIALWSFSLVQHMVFSHQSYWVDRENEKVAMESVSNIEKNCVDKNYSYVHPGVPHSPHLEHRRLSAPGLLPRTNDVPLCIDPAQYSSLGTSHELPMLRLRLAILGELILL